MKIEFFRHSIDEDDINRAADVLRSIFLTTGDVVDEFEAKFAGYTGSRCAVGVTSCTAALHLGLLAYDVGPGDEVITTPMSFCATANAVLHAGARPVFVDVEPETGNINADLIERVITDKTKAIMPVHMYGQMCDMKKIRQVADKYKLVIIEDAAHALEAERDGLRPGHAGEAACFSFYATKSITSGEGGAITISDEEKTRVLKMLRLHGMDAAASERYTGRYEHWDMPVLGWKYNMSNIQAALLIGQIARIEDMWLKRDVIWKRYEEGLSGLKGITVLKTLPDSRHARHLFTILVDPAKRDHVLHELQDKGVGVAVNYRPVHLLEYYRKSFSYKAGDFPVAEDIGSRTISLPLYPGLNREEAGFVTEAVRDCVLNRHNI